MNIHVTLEGERLSEAALTDMTDERLLAGVCGHVAGQVVSVSEPFVAQLAVVRPLGAVCPAVSVALVAGRESLVARRARERVGAGHVLHPVPLERVRVSEALAADGARVRPVRDARVRDGHVSADEPRRRELDAALEARLSWRRSGGGQHVARRLAAVVAAPQVTVQLVAGQEALAAARARVRRHAAVVPQHVPPQRLPRAAAATTHRAAPHRRRRHLPPPIIVRRRLPDTHEQTRPVAD